MAREINMGGVRYVLAGSSDQGNVYVIQNSESEQSDNSQSSSQEVSLRVNVMKVTLTNILSMLSISSMMLAAWERNRLSCSKNLESVLKRSCPPMIIISVSWTRER